MAAPKSGVAIFSCSIIRKVLNWVSINSVCG